MHFNLHDRPNLHPLQMESTLNSLLDDLSFCIDTCGMSDEQVEEYLDCCERHDTNAFYFAEEFMCLGDESGIKIHNDDYLSLDAFNAYHGIYFEEVE